MLLDCRDGVRSVQQRSDRSSTGTPLKWNKGISSQIPMPAKDVFHEVVKKALQKDGWQITHDPLSFRVGGVNMSIDLAAEKLIAAEREGEKIAVEIKSFLEKSSAISEFHTALGQFINYRAALRRREPERILDLAVPLTTYKTFFQLNFPQEMVQKNQVNMIIYDVKHEVIFEWKN